MSRTANADAARRRARIALVIERFEPRGGVEGVAWQVAHRLAGAGEEVEVFARQASEKAQVAVQRLSVSRGWQPLRLLRFSHAAARATRDHEIVHTFSRTRHQHIYRAGGGCHADYMERAYRPVGRRLRRVSPRHAVILAIEQAVFRDPRQLVQCNSEMVRAQLRSRYGIAAERLVVIPNGVDLNRFSPDPASPERQRVREELGADDGAIAFLLVGHGFRRKGVDTAIRALARCASPEAKLWVAGGDDPAPYRGLALELGVAERVSFLGAREDTAPLYAAADALLLPTRYDAFANVCLEAAAAGLPVVTSGSNGAAGWLADAGVTVESAEDVDGFAAALSALASGPRRASLGRAARARAETAGWDQHIAALLAVYDRVHAR